MLSNPLFIITDFFCIFQTNFAMTTLGLKEMGKFLWEGREKVLPSWLSQFSFVVYPRRSVKILCEIYQNIVCLISAAMMS